MACFTLTLMPTVWAPERQQIGNHPPATHNFTEVLTLYLPNRQQIVNHLPAAYNLTQKLTV